MTKPTVSAILANVFGSDFSEATQEQRLLLVEVIVLCLRTGGAWSNKLHFVCSRTKAPAMPEACFFFAEIGRNEGLKLLAVLQVAIVEGYAALAFTK